MKSYKQVTWMAGARAIAESLPVSYNSGSQPSVLAEAFALV